MAFVIRRIHAPAVSQAVVSLLPELRLTQRVKLYREMMDTALTSGYQGAVSLVDHKGEEPARCLDIGTGVCVSPLFLGETRTDLRIPCRCPRAVFAVSPRFSHAGTTTRDANLADACRRPGSNATGSSAVTL